MSGNNNRQHHFAGVVFEGAEDDLNLTSNARRARRPSRISTTTAGSEPSGQGLTVPYARRRSISPGLRRQSVAFQGQHSSRDEEAAAGGYGNVGRLRPGVSFGEDVPGNVGTGIGAGNEGRQRRSFTSTVGAQQQAHQQRLLQYSPQPPRHHHSRGSSAAPTAAGDGSSSGRGATGSAPAHRRATIVVSSPDQPHGGSSSNYRPAPPTLGAQQPKLQASGVYDEDQLESMQMLIGDHYMLFRSLRESVYVGASWETKNSNVKCDMDVSVLLFDDHHKKVDHVSFGRKYTRNKSVMHLGDDVKRTELSPMSPQSGSAMGGSALLGGPMSPSKRGMSKRRQTFFQSLTLDNETVKINFPTLPPEVTTLWIILNMYTTGRQISDLKCLRLRLSTENLGELCSFEIPQNEIAQLCAQDPRANAIITGVFKRDARGVFDFIAASQLSAGKTHRETTQDCHDLSTMLAAGWNPVGPFEDDLLNDPSSSSSSSDDGPAQGVGKSATRGRRKSLHGKYTKKTRQLHAQKKQLGGKGFRTGGDCNVPKALYSLEDIRNSRRSGATSPDVDDNVGHGGPYGRQRGRGNIDDADSPRGAGGSSGSDGFDTSDQEVPERFDTATPDGEYDAGIHEGFSPPNRKRKYRNRTRRQAVMVYSTGRSVGCSNDADSEEEFQLAVSRVFPQFKNSRTIRYDDGCYNRGSARQQLQMHFQRHRHEYTLSIPRRAPTPRLDTSSSSDTELLGEEANLLENAVVDAAALIPVLGSRKKTKSAPGRGSISVGGKSRNMSAAKPRSAQRQPARPLDNEFDEWLTSLGAGMVPAKPKAASASSSKKSVADSSRHTSARHGTAASNRSAKVSARSSIVANMMGFGF